MKKRETNAQTPTSPACHSSIADKSRRWLALLTVCLALFTLAPGVRSADQIFNSVGQGWYDISGHHDSWNLNYLVGRSGSEFRNYFSFDLSSLALTDMRIVGATLTVFGADEYHNTDLVYELFDVTTPAEILAADSISGDPSGLAIFEDLGTGESYGTLGPRPPGSSSYGYLSIPLNAAARTALAAGPLSFSIGGIIQGLSQTTGEFYLFGGSGGTPQQLVIETRPVDDLSPVARCKDATVTAGPDCYANASVDNGSFDLNGNPFTIVQDPPGPYPVGTTPVTLTVANSLGFSSCSALVTVVEPGVACINLTPAGSCFDAQVFLSQPDFHGEVIITGAGTAPESLVFEILNTCYSGDTYSFYLNGVLLGETAANQSGDCTCDPPLETFTFDDSGVIASAWDVLGNNTFRFVKNGFSTSLAWARVLLHSGGFTKTFCLFDTYGGNCDQLYLCAAGYDSAPVDQSSTMAEPFAPPIIAVPYQDSLLPTQLDISALPNGDYSFCVSGLRPWETTPRVNCRSFTQNGAQTIIINGPGQCALPPNRPPVARCQDVYLTAGADCSPATASIDAGSYDPDGDSITLTQDPPGPYPVGSIYVMLTVTDIHGSSSSCNAYVTVFPPPVACISITSGGTCLDATIQLSQPYFSGSVFVVDSGSQTVAQAEYQDSLLPPQLDIASLPDGSYSLCVNDQWQQDCVAFVKNGESSIIINGPGQCALPPNRPPMARCQDVYVAAAADCSPTIASIDAGSYDPDADSITLTQDPPGPYPVGSTYVTLTVKDGQDLSSSCGAYVTVLPPPVACINVTSGGACLDANITLSDLSSFTGDVFVPGATPGIPPALVFEMLTTSIGGTSGDSFEFYLNGTSLGQVAAASTPGLNFTCEPGIQAFTVDQALVVAHWNIDGNNTLEFSKNGYANYTSWVRVRFGAEAGGQTLCLFGNCGQPNLCYAGYYYGPIVAAQMLVEAFMPRLAAAHYQDSLLPVHLDIAALAVGDYSLCVTGQRPWESQAQQDCVPFTKSDPQQQQIIINGPGGCVAPPNRPPVAKCRDVTAVITGNCLAQASIDNGSYDPDGDTVTLVQDPPAPYPAGWNWVVLTVTDSHGEVSSCGSSVYVPGPTVACIDLAASSACVDAKISLVDPINFTGDVYVPGSPSIPTTMVFEILTTSAGDGSGDSFDFYLNGNFLGQVDAASTPGFGFICEPEVQTVTADPALVAQFWNIDGNNTIEFSKNGYANYTSWVQVRLGTGAGSQTLCLFGGCGQPNLCNAGYYYGPLFAGQTVAEPFSSSIVSAHYQDSLLPAHLDISLLADGNYVLCVSGQRPWEYQAQKDCAAFTKSGQTQILINGPGACVPPANRPPVVKCRDVNASVAGNCLADVSIDAGSYDPDGEAIVITLTPPGPYPLGSTQVELTATDAGGLSSTCQATVNVLAPPAIDCPPNVTVAASAGQSSAVVDFAVTAQVPCNFGKTFLRGFVLMEVYRPESTSDNNLDATLLADPNFPDHPAEKLALTAFDSRTVYPDDSHSGYGARISGYFLPPVDGNYIFYLRTDDSSRLYLNPAGPDPAGKILLQEEFFWGVNFSDHPSAPQALTAGMQYYIELIYKEGSGGDYGQVAVKLDTDPTDPNSLTPIPGSMLGQYFDSEVTVVCDPPSGSLFQLGITTVTCTASGGLGNSAQCSFTVTVEDREPPTILCPADLEITTAAGQCTPAVTFSPVVTDNHDGKLIPGSAVQELYFDIAGWSVDDLRASPKYPNAPDLSRLRASLEANTFDEYEFYGTRISGLLLPPVSGDYTFYLASDDGGEFWLSTDEEPANLVQIAREPTWANRRQFVGEAGGSGRGDPPINVSAPIALVAGQKYYFEALMKEGQIGDHLAVAWQMPGGPQPVNGSEPIGGDYLAMRTAPASIVCNPPSGSAFPVGTTRVNCTATDSSGNSSTCSFDVTVLGTISGRKFYDANANGTQDAGEPGISGWKIVATESGGAIATAFTDADGNYLFDAPVGTYTVSEVSPNANWAATTPTSQKVEVTRESCNPVCLFGNVCVSAPANGFGLGFWSNPTGKTILSANDPAWRTALNACNLRNPDGSLYLVPSGSFSTAFGNFRTWMLNATAKNMASMLSAQLAATTLNVQYQNLSDNTALVVPACLETSAGANVIITLGLPVIHGPLGVPACAGNSCASGNGYVTIETLRAMAQSSLLATGTTSKGSAVRTYQECLKVLLEQLNHNGNNGYNCPLTQMIAPTAAACPFTTPY